MKRARNASNRSFPTERTGSPIGVGDDEGGTIFISWGTGDKPAWGIGMKRARNTPNPSFLRKQESRVCFLRTEDKGPEPFDFAFGYAQDRRSGAKSKGLS